MPERALTRAAELDQYLEEHKKPVGSLHGLPSSGKEHVGMKGLDVSVSIAVWVGKVANDDAALLKILWEAGAIFYVRTTQPQSLVSESCLRRPFLVSSSAKVVSHITSERPQSKRDSLAQGC